MTAIHIILCTLLSLSVCAMREGAQQVLDSSSSPTRFSVVEGFFAQSDPDTDPDTFPVLPPHLGLMDDADGRWERFTEKLAALQASIGEKGTVKFMLLQRHGE